MACFYCLSDEFVNTLWMLLEVILSFIGLMLVCFVVSKVIGPMFRYVHIFNFTCTSDLCKSVKPLHKSHLEDRGKWLL